MLLYTNSNNINIDTNNTYEIFSPSQLPSGNHIKSLSNPPTSSPTLLLNNQIDVKSQAFLSLENVFIIVGAILALTLLCCGGWYLKELLSVMGWRYEMITRNDINVKKQELFHELSERPILPTVLYYSYTMYLFSQDEEVQLAIYEALSRSIQASVTYECVMEVYKCVIANNNTNMNERRFRNGQIYAIKVLGNIGEIFPILITDEMRDKIILLKNVQDERDINDAATYAWNKLQTGIQNEARYREDMREVRIGPSKNHDDDELEHKNSDPVHATKGGKTTSWSK